MNVQRVKIGLILFLSVISSVIFARPQSNLPYAGGWNTPTVTGENISEYEFKSRLVGQKVNYHVFYPEQLKTYRGPVPTLIWLHGSFSSLQGIVPLSNYFKSAIDNGQIKPMAVVFPHGLNQSLWVDSKDGRYPVEKVLVNELIPDLKNHFNFRPDRVKPMIAGFSMGGYGAGRLYFKYPDLFSGAIALAAGPLNENFETASGSEGQREVLLEEIFDNDMRYYQEVNPKGEALKFSRNTFKPHVNFTIMVGDVDKTYHENQRFTQYLKSLNIEHNYIVINGADHNMKQVLQLAGNQFLDIINRTNIQSLKRLRKSRNNRRRPNTSRSRRRN